MGVKLTYEFIKESFLKDNYILLSKEYINNTTKLDYKCSKGHKHSIRWGNWNTGYRCPYCSGKIKLTFKFVRESFENEDYILLSKEYIGANTKLNYRCPKDHEHSIKWGDWQQGHRCPTCAGKVKLTLNKVKDSFENEGYTLLSKKYINANTKLDYICSMGHEHSIVWGSWQQGKRCPYCAGHTKPTLNQIVNSFKYKNYTLLSTEYINNSTKLDYICSKGHEHSMSWNNWKGNRKCPTCDDIERSGPGNSQWQGGISYEPYCSIWKDKEYKADIRERDGNKCLNPACNKNNSRLTIHHIDYNKKNCSPSNLITICNSCNVSANKDRDWHTTWYSAIIKNRYYSRSA